MKPLTMKAPALEQIYNQRYQYEQHKKKLMKIYEDRKSQLGYDSTRISHFEQIKEAKTKSFIHKFNQTNSNIAKENLKLLGKLESAKTSLQQGLRASTSEEHRRERSTLSYINPYTKQRMQETEKENMRISARMKNMSSSLNQKNFVREYAKSQQIKNRLMRYSSNETRVYLKSERYLGDDASLISHEKGDQQDQPEQHESAGKKFAIKPVYRKSGVSHYRRDEILKHKVDISTSNLAGIKQKYHSMRPNTSMETKPAGEGHSFFATEPRKEKLKSFKKKIHLA